MSDTKTHRVQVVSVNENAVIQGKKGPYSGLEFKYVQNGEQKSKAIHNAFFERSAVLIEALKSFKEGDTIELTVEGAPFFGMVSANKLGEAGSVLEAPRSTQTIHQSHTKSTFVDNSIGMQVGNALTNASNIMASGQIVHKGGEEFYMYLALVASRILHLGEDLKAGLIAGKFAHKEEEKSVPLKKDTKTKASSNPKKDEGDLDEDDDMKNPFGD